jgi:RNA-directed DNA polymerase
MSVEQLKPHLKEHWPRIKEELLSERYKPAPVRGVEIPKPGGKGMRLLGIPMPASYCTLFNPVPVR